MFSNVLICNGVVALQSVLKPIRGDSDYRPTSEHNYDDDDGTAMAVEMAGQKDTGMRNQTRSSVFVVYLDRVWWSPLFF